MKKGIFKIIRNGEFQASQPTDNQCAEEGHARYFYELKLAFDGGAQLDQNGFLIDTREIDQLIQATPLAGSCEQMHLRLQRLFCERLGASLIAYKMSIKPVRDAKGWIDFGFASDPVLLNCF